MQKTGYTPRGKPATGKAAKRWKPTKERLYQLDRGALDNAGLTPQEYERAVMQACRRLKV